MKIPIMSRQFLQAYDKRKNVNTWNMYTKPNETLVCVLLTSLGIGESGKHPGDKNLHNVDIEVVCDTFSLAKEIQIETR